MAGGTLLKNIAITGYGRQEIKVDIKDLSIGIYAYSLVIDGKRVATKKMSVMK
jgi:hypothetical protein